MDGQTNGYKGGRPAPAGNERKLFIGGLRTDTTQEELQEHFSSFGVVENANVNARGFGFVTFQSADSVDQALSQNEHVIRNRSVDVQKVKVKPGKIFVGGLNAQISDDDIKNHFASYGKIVETEMPFDKVKQQRKGFCFITFENQAVLRDVLRNSRQVINGKEVDVKKANPKPEPGAARGGGFDDYNGGYNQYQGGYNQGGGGGGGNFDQGGFDEGYNNDGGYSGGGGGSGGGSSYQAPQQNQSQGSFNSFSNRGRGGGGGGSFGANQRGGGRGGSFRGGRGRFQPY